MTTVNLIPKHYCYYVCPSITNIKNGEIQPAIVVEGIAGYFPTDYTWGHDPKIAEKCAADKNRRLGLTDEDVDRIIMSSMFPKKLSRHLSSSHKDLKAKDEHFWEKSQKKILHYFKSKYRYFGEKKISFR